ncbi:hypothetical protein AURDEDRAFT_75824 [Auricularia subglabra TFB-10046 SS5]|uniref:CxC2-like cysteine cluster KDZ transposase-associated domain-containing protein n=1 Tax=Auricularia subglabra (strain TFB-10046 / SS5) TaxID=717982 RepID=J0D764_AURST|nr:hypothetical protein AURDEDRAFT_75824 [Auricularia subglabra TFB-10046 SS5]
MFPYLGFLAVDQLRLPLIPRTIRVTRCYNTRCTTTTTTTTTKVRPRRYPPTVVGRRYASHERSLSKEFVLIFTSYYYILLLLVSQPISTVMAEFMQRQSEILDYMFAREADARTSVSCACRSATDPAIYRCRECILLPPCCGKCMKLSHSHAPFHRIEAWTGSYFARSSLTALGYELCLGHDGARCPNATTQECTKLMVIVHTNGVHRLNVVFCACASCAQKPYQMLQSSLYPATWTSPATAFTFQLMEHYHLDSLQSRKPAYDYWALLRRLTDNTRAKPVPDRYEELLRVSWEWRVLKMMKRSGQALGISEFLPNHSNSMAIPCFACPIPGFNLPPNWKDLVTKDNRHEYTLFLGIDGNYQAVRKKKRHDPLDIPLLDGQGYFTNSTKYKAFLKRISANESDNHTSSCANLKSMKIFTRRKGLDVSGVAGVTCRHSCWRANSMVDLEVGEKSVYTSTPLGGI